MGLKRGGLRSSLRSVSQGSAIPDSGVLYYPYEQSVTDGWNSNNGANQGITYSSDSQDGTYAGVWDGADDYVDFPDLGIFAGSSQYSISVWFNTSELSQRMAGIRIEGEYDVRHEFNNGKLRYTSYDGSNESAVATSSEFTSDTWHHAVWVYDSGTIQIYFDGSLDVEDSVQTNYVTKDRTNHIGYDQGDNSTYYGGLMDELKIYDKKLSGTEVSDLYNNGSI